MRNARFVGRVRVVAGLLCLMVLAILGKLYFLQVVRGQEYQRQAEAQQVQLQNPLLNRGSIYFTDQEGTLITAATLTGVASSSTHQRYYPGGSLAAQVIGFVAYNGDHEQKGRYGLERYYDQTLTSDGADSYANFFVQLFGGFSQALQGGAGGEGSVVTTIEPTAQTELERTLNAYATQWHPKIAGGVIMDPSTGEIVAMAATPTFDLNRFNQEQDALVYANPNVENVYEMGSIIKPLTLAVGLDSGAITETTTYNDTGCISVNEKQICNFDAKARGVIPMQQILSQSLNVGASFVATKMGPTIMANYFVDHYKLGEETGVDLPGEIHGLVKNLLHGQAVDYDTASFGQGIALTPIETTRALASLGNGGRLVTPHVVKAIKYDSGVVRTLSWGSDVAVLKPQTSTTISRMLTEVVDTNLANGALKLEHYSVAAKTGTAQVADPINGGYYPDKYLHSFFGYFPSFSPRFIVFLWALEPQGAPFASQTWAPPFGDLVKFLINYYNIPPDR